ncbi:MAG: hypothetical protein BMS9Abin29_0206 [Gemmatimonadota bacterium]|nr:MAG: hypothetical protein BMS9Abin29_0206 [Gemmatimonadota bacterium]
MKSWPPYGRATLKVQLAILYAIGRCGEIDVFPGSPLLRIPPRENAAGYPLFFQKRTLLTPLSGYPVDVGIFLVYTVNMALHRDEILRQACGLLIAGGLDSLSMRELARRLGVTAPALYRHYESKEKVLVDVVGEAIKTFAHYLYQALEGKTPVERFSLTGMRYLDFALEHPQFYEIIHVSHQLIGLEELPKEASSHSCATGQFMIDRVREGVECGMLKTAEPNDVAMSIWAHAHGIVSLYHRGLLGMDEEQFRQFFRQSTWRLMKGIADDEFVAAMDDEVSQAVALGEAPTGRGPRPMEGRRPARP